MWRPSALLIAVLGCITLAACSVSVSGLSLEEQTVGRGQRSERVPDFPDADPDDVVALALEDLATYWDRELPRVYGESFEPFAGGLAPYGPGTPVPQCGPDRILYEDIAGNALYCPAEDLIAWDRVALIPDLDAEFGPLTVGIVMAHEFAHAIQARAGVRGETVLLELQADCFAGAWVADATDRIDVFTTEGGTLDHAIGGFLELRDTVGVASFDPNAHGSGFDRVSAFQDGYQRGNEVCAGYEADPPPVVAIPFVSLSDLQSEGNLPLDQLLDLLLTDLDAFFADLVRREGGEWDPVDGPVAVDPGRDVVECGDETLAGEDLELASFYCVADDTVYIDREDLVPALERIGDFAFGGEVARQYAYAAQAKLGLLATGADTDLHADCVTGVYSAAEFNGEIPGDQALALSPGDLDEIIIAFLAFGSGDASAFERTAAFRTGFLDGYDACEAFLD